jgi:gliding motility-associated-like protein
VRINGCNSDPGSIAIQVNQTPAAPTVTSPVTYCQNATATALTATGTNLIWYNNAGLANGTATAPTPITTTVGASNFYVVDSSNAGCKSTPSSNVVNVNATPIIGNVIVSNPTACATNTGSIKFDVSPTTGNFTVSYTKNGGSPTTLTNVTATAGAITIGSLTAGLYDNIRVTLNNCPSNILGPITLNDPTPPTTPIIIAPANICSGNVLNLSASTTSVGTTTYQWTGPSGFTATGANASITNVATRYGGIFSVTATIAGCTSMAGTATVVIDSTPARPSITSNTPVCTDSTLSLFATTASAGTMTYNWTGVNGFTSTIQNPSISSVTTANAGSYNVTATSTINTNCISPIGTNTVVVNQTPVISSITSTNPTQCATSSGSISFNVLPTTGNFIVTYTKNSVTQTANLTAVSGVITINNLGASTYNNIKVTLNSCPSNQLGPVTLVDPNPPATPVITSVDSICSGNTLNLSALTTSVGLATYNWTYPNGATNTGQIISIPNIATKDSGVYRVTVTIANCVSLTGIKHIRVDSTPTKPIIVSNSPVCRDSSIAISSTTNYPFAVNYSWSFNSNAVSTNRNFTIPNAQNSNAGFYKLVVTSSKNCVASPDSVNVLINPTPVINLQDSTNPTQCATPTGNIKLSGLLPNTSYQIYYTINAGVKTQTQTSNSASILTVDTLRAGTYSNIFVVLNGCPSLPVGPVTLKDPNPPATPIITAVDSICSGNNLLLAAATSSVGTAIYTWTFPNGFTTTGQNLNLNNIPTFLGGTFTITATINSCISSVGTKIIRVDSTPVKPIINSNSPICSNNNLLLTSSTNTTGAMNYSWTGANGFVSTLQNPTKPNMQLADGGSYNVTYTSVVGGCVTQMATTAVVVHPTPTVNPVKDTTYKDGVPSGLIAFTGAISGTTFNWTNTNTAIGLSATGTGNISFNTTNTTAFPISGTVIVTPSTAFCTGLPTTFIITVNPTPKLTSLLNDTICTNNSFNYQASSSTPSVKFTWVRNMVSGISNAASSSTDSLGTISEILVNTTNTIINVPYTFKLYHLGTVSTQDVVLTVYPNAKASYNFVSNKLCAPGKIDSNNIVLQPFSSINAGYNWYVNDVRIGSGIKFPGYTILTNGDTVNVKLVALSKRGCKPDSVTYKFYTVKRPTVGFTKSTNKGCGPLSVNFTNNTTPLTEPNYLWDFGNGTTSNLANPNTVIYNADLSTRRRDTTYYVSLKAFNSCDTVYFNDSVIVRPKPLALFQPDTTIGCSPFRFRAFNNSVGTPNNYTWDFGNGNTLSNNTNGFVTNTYNTGIKDTFTVKLIAQNECGIDSFKVDVVVFPNTVRPNLIIDGNAATGCAPQTIRMVNNSTNANRYVLNFGDGSTAYISTQAPDTIFHTYSNAGTYTVSLLASNGCSDSSTNQTLTFYSKPTASFTTPKTTYCAKENISFTNTSATGLRYEWFFADGNTANSFNATHSFANAGTYIVKLAVKNIVATGVTCTDTARVTITVIANPIATITSNAKPQNCAPFTFVGSTNQPNTNVVNWYFGNPFSTDTTRVGNNATHIFAIPGTYTIRQIVINQNGCTDTARTLVNVIETPQAKFVLSDSLICAPGKVVNALNQTIYSPLDAVDYKWLVNGFVQANSRNFSNNYTASINITTAVVNTIQLISTNSFGCTDTADARITIQPKPQPNFTTNINTGCVPLTLSINNTSTFANIFKWYINNNLVSTDSLPLAQTLTIPSSNYIIKLVADHRLGCGIDSILKPITTFSKPQAAIRISNRSSCTGILNVQFNDLSYVVGSTVNNWNWQFGNGANSASQNPNYTYTIPGQYIANLVVTDARGCVSDTAFVTLKNFGKPTSRFNVNNVCLNAPVAPINLSSLGFGSTAFTQYQWDFGDGTITTGFAPTHVYKVEGNYVIRLITTSDSSCVADTAVFPIRVIGKPKANFRVTNNCINVGVRFFDQSLIGFADNAIGSYSWNFGNGNFSNAANPTTNYNTTGNYPVQLIVAGSICPTLKDTISKLVTIYRARNSMVYPRIETVRNSATPLQSQSGGVDYLWSPAIGLSNTLIQNPIANYDATAPNIINYNIAITDSVGCIVVDRQEVWIFNQPDILVPTAFTPNGDAANDVLLPFYVSINRLLYFRVYDRWGKQVFETSQIGKPWDGTQNGKPMPMDTYVWVAEGISKDGLKIARKGNVTLVRD